MKGQYKYTGSENLMPAINRQPGFPILVKPSISRWRHKNRKVCTTSNRSFQYSLVVFVFWFCASFFEDSFAEIILFIAITIYDARIFIHKSGVTYLHFGGSVANVGASLFILKQETVYEMSAVSARQWKYLD